jgi:hypothetical protein
LGAAGHDHPAPEQPPTPEPVLQPRTGSLAGDLNLGIIEGLLLQAGSDKTRILSVAERH